jgi:hypothetical protein
MLSRFSLLLLSEAIWLRTASAACRLTPRWSGRVKDKVPSPKIGARAAQPNR